MNHRLSFNEVIGSTIALMTGDLPVVLGVVAVLTAISTISDFTAPFASFAIAIAVLVTQYYLTRRLIDRQALRSAERSGGFWSFVLLNIYTSLAIGLGFLLLILPGIYLSARWSMAGAALLAENEGSTAARRQSGEATRDHILPIALGWVLIVLPLIIGAFLLGGMDVIERNSGGIGVTVVALDVLFNAMIYLSQVATWYFGVAIYQLVAAPAETRFGEVFA